MLETIPQIGRELRKKFHWIPSSQLIYLSLENAGGHGINEAKEKYTAGLLEYNIEIIWQILRSPETNMFDLGVWMAV